MEPIQEMPNEESLHDQVIVKFIFITFLLKLILVFSTREEVCCFGRTICKFRSFMNIHKGLETEARNQNFLVEKVKTESLVHFPYLWLYLMYVYNTVYCKYFCF